MINQKYTPYIVNVTSGKFYNQTLKVKGNGPKDAAECAAIRLYGTKGINMVAKREDKGNEHWKVYLPNGKRIAFHAQVLINLSVAAQ